MSAFLCACCRKPVDVRLCLDALPLELVFFVLCDFCRGDWVRDQSTPFPEGEREAQANAIEASSRRFGEAIGKLWLGAPAEDWGHA